MTNLISILFVMAQPQPKAFFGGDCQLSLASGATMDLALQSSSFRCSTANMGALEHDGFLEYKGGFSRKQKAIWEKCPGNSHIPPWEKVNHLQTLGYVSSQEGMILISGLHTGNRVRLVEGVKNSTTYCG